MPSADPVELAALIRGLRADLVILRDGLPPVAPSLPTTVPPPSVRTRSKAAVAGLVAGKYAPLMLLGGVVLRGVAKQWPEFGELIESLLQLVGL